MTHEVTMKAGQLSSVAQSFQALEGARPVQLSYKIGKIMQEADAAHSIMVETLQPMLEPDGTVAEDNDTAMAVLNEDVTLSVPQVTLAELEDAELTVTNDIALVFLTSTNIVAEDV